MRSDDAYTPGGVGGKRPDRSVIVYAQRAREAFKDVPIVIGGIEASLRRIAHFDYWSEKVRRSVLLDAKADLLVYGNGERQICEIAHRLAAGESIREITDVRGTAFARKSRARRAGSRSTRRIWMRRGRSRRVPIRTPWSPERAAPGRAAAGRRRRSDAAGHARRSCASCGA